MSNQAVNSTSPSTNTYNDTNTENITTTPLEETADNINKVTKGKFPKVNDDIYKSLGTASTSSNEKHETINSKEFAADGKESIQNGIDQIGSGFSQLGSGVADFALAGQAAVQEELGVVADELGNAKEVVEKKFKEQIVNVAALGAKTATLAADGATNVAEFLNEKANSLNETETHSVEQPITLISNNVEVSNTSATPDTHKIPLTPDAETDFSKINADNATSNATSGQGVNDAFDAGQETSANPDFLNDINTNSRSNITFSFLDKVTDSVYGIKNFVGEKYNQTTNYLSDRASTLTETAQEYVAPGTVLHKPYDATSDFVQKNSSAIGCAIGCGVAAGGSSIFANAAVKLIQGRATNQFAEVKRVALGATMMGLSTLISQNKLLGLAALTGGISQAIFTATRPMDVPSLAFKKTFYLQKFNRYNQFSNKRANR